MSSTQSTAEQLRIMIRTGIPIIWVNTYEEVRFIQEFAKDVIDVWNTDKAGPGSKLELWAWSLYQGILSLDEINARDNQRKLLRAEGDRQKTPNPATALEWIVNYEPELPNIRPVFLLKDFNVVLEQPIVRMLRDAIHPLQIGRKTLIIVSPFLSHGRGGGKPGVEPTLEKQIKVVDFVLPDREQLADIFDLSLKHLSHQAKKATVGYVINYSDEEKNEIVTALQGLTRDEAQDAMTASMLSCKKIEPNYLIGEKKQIIKKSDILEYVEKVPPLDQVGGLDQAKTFLMAYKNQFSDEAKAFGVEPLKGIIILGPPGGGKSLLTKAIASAWQLPLLRLDMGRVMGSLVGESERRMRDAIAQMEACAPCIVQIDEIEKGLSGTQSSTSTDGGTTSRVFGTLLTSMEERMRGVVIVATANDISMLPPELIRRFNEVFFVDLPSAAERETILQIHLSKRGRDVSQLKLDFKQLISASHDYTGAELEKAVKEAIARAFNRNKMELTTELMLECIKDVKPIAQVMKEKISDLREWAKTRARYASSSAAKYNNKDNPIVTTPSGKELDLKSELDDLDEIFDGSMKGEL